MKMIFLILVTSVIAGCGPKVETTSNLNQIKKAAIVGGVEVDSATTDTSFIVSIGGACAGSIIDAKWILTAAHCQPVFRSKITGGSINLKDAKRIQLKVVRSYVHPKYSSSQSSNDFALLELAKPIDFAATKLGKIEIAGADLESSGGLEDGTMTTVYGWGVTSEDGTQPSVMREVDVPLVSRERANAPDAYDNQIDETMIAAGYDEGGKDSCQGDSGGPLVIREKTSGVQTLVGVVSFGEGCARELKYGIYSNVSYGNAWIKSIIKKNK